MTNGNGQISADTVYSELYEEGRYFRNHELTVSTWYSIILLAILATILAVKSSSSNSSIHQILSNNLIIKICVAIVICVIGISGLLSIRYSKKRYGDIRNHLDSIEPSNKNFKKTDIKYTPRQLIFYSSLILTIITIIVIFIP